VRYGWLAVTPSPTDNSTFLPSLWRAAPLARPLYLRAAQPCSSSPCGGFSISAGEFDSPVSLLGSSRRLPRTLDHHGRQVGPHPFPCLVRQDKDSFPRLSPEVVRQGSAFVDSPPSHKPPAFTGLIHFSVSVIRLHPPPEGSVSRPRSRGAWRFQPASSISRSASCRHVRRIPFVGGVLHFGGRGWPMNSPDEIEMPLSEWSSA
jgi:hypothetical protein